MLSARSSAALARSGLLSLATAIMLAACGADSSPGADVLEPAADGGANVDAGGANDAPSAPGVEGQPSVSVLFSPETKRVLLEVDYAPGAEPYTGATGRLGSIWEIYRDNANAIFDGRKEVVFPSTLPEMERLDDVSGDRFDKIQLLTIAAAHRTTPSSGEMVSFYVLFVPGIFVDDEGHDSPDTLGVSFGGTGVIAMFKPVIAGTATRGTTTPRFVEQSTLVHEIGHAVGLVDNGVPAASAHTDPAHVHHCANDACVMFWANEGAKDAVDFVKAYVETGDRVLFRSGCLQDLRAFEATLGPASN